MNFVISPILKLVAIATIVLSTLGYINVLRSDNKALEASVERYKHDAEHNASIANQNAELLQEQKLDYENLFNEYQQLQDTIQNNKDIQMNKEKEVVKYVERLPEGFEKQCLNMLVPDSIGRVQK